MANTPTWDISTWIHDAEEPSLSLQEIWDEREQRAQQHYYGLCCDCKVGLDNRDEFFVDNRDWSGTYQICNACFEKSFGKDAFQEAALAESKGQRPQWSRW